MMMPQDRETVCLSKPGVHVAKLSDAYIQRLRKKIGADDLRFESKNGVVCITIFKKPAWRVDKIATSLDFTRWFKNKECLLSWNTFYDCMNKKRNPQDELLYQKLDRMFVAKITCGEGEKCERDFLFWRFYWDAPAQMRLEAKIGRGGFASVEEAKRSLAKINALLKKVVYGARFSRSYDENDESSFYHEHSVNTNYHYFSQATKQLFELLQKHNYLQGLKEVDKKAIARLAHPGVKILYIPKGCTLPYGGKSRGEWIDVGVAKIEFGDCPRVQMFR